MSEFEKIYSTWLIEDNRMTIETMKLFAENNGFVILQILSDLPTALSAIETFSEKHTENLMSC